MDAARNVFAVIGLLTVLATGGVAVLLVQVAVEARADRRRKERAAVAKFRTDMTAYELLSSASDPSGSEDDRS